ncbi:unnamed protein product [Somion occarium]|uniref:Uncharacterized protein n=1 Tax=Somion occarium TaxID=3059160 RepID=A0ABP1DU58_9APHY
MDRAQLSKLSRPEIQRYARQANIKANLKTIAIIKALLEKYPDGVPPITDAKRKSERKSNKPEPPQRSGDHSGGNDKETVAKDTPTNESHSPRELASNSPPLPTEDVSDTRASNEPSAAPAPVKDTQPEVSKEQPSAVPTLTGPKDHPPSPPAVPVPIPLSPSPPAQPLPRARSKSKGRYAPSPETLIRESIATVQHRQDQNDNVVPTTSGTPRVIRNGGPEPARIAALRPAAAQPGPSRQGAPRAPSFRQFIAGPRPRRQRPTVDHDVLPTEPLATEILATQIVPTEGAPIADLSSRSSDVFKDEPGEETVGPTDGFEVASTAVSRRDLYNDMLAATKLQNTRANFDEAMGELGELQNLVMDRWLRIEKGMGVLATVRTIVEEVFMKQWKTDSRLHDNPDDSGGDEEDYESVYEAEEQAEPELFWLDAEEPELPTRGTKRGREEEGFVPNKRLRS